jgi:hypothetical protein
MERYQRYYYRDKPEAATFAAENRENYRKQVEMMGHLQGLLAAKFRTDPVDGDMWRSRKRLWVSCKA